MSTELDICNLALSRLGDSAIVASINPPEGSAQAEHCARFYPIARGVVLEAHNWLFATRRLPLSRLDTDTFNWAYAYAVPNQTLKVISVLPPTGSSEDDSQDYEIESGDSANVILTNQPDAVAKVLVLITDTTRYSYHAADAIAWLLASYLAGPLLKNEAGAAAAAKCFQAYRAVIGEAKVFDANQRRVTPTHTPTWIGER